MHCENSLRVIRRILRRERGATALEGLMASFIMLLSIVAVWAVASGWWVRTTMDTTTAVAIQTAAVYYDRNAGFAANSPESVSAINEAGIRANQVLQFPGTNNSISRQLEGLRLSAGPGCMTFPGYALYSLSDGPAVGGGRQIVVSLQSAGYWRAPLRGVNGCVRSEWEAIFRR